MLKIKLIAIGNSNVGKTTLIHRLANDEFTDTEFTIGVDYITKDVILKNHQTIKVAMWDTAGQERFRSLIVQYYRGSHIVLLVYDITDQNSILALYDWYEQINDSNKKIIILIGNKIDLPENEENKQLIIDLIKKINIYGHFLVSSKTGKNFDFLLNKIVNVFYKEVYNESGVCKTNNADYDFIDIIDNVINYSPKTENKCC